MDTILQSVLAYENKDVISRFLDKYKASETEAYDIFLETKKWLFASNLNNTLYQNQEHDFIIGINNDILIIDEMWHNFILFTKDYNSFCDHHFKRFIHHQPSTKKQKEQNSEEEQVDFLAVQERRKIFYQKQYSFIFDLFGKETLVKWHKEYPIKYSVNNIRHLRK